MRGRVGWLTVFGFVLVGLVISFAAWYAIMRLVVYLVECS